MHATDTHTHTHRQPHGNAHNALTVHIAIQMYSINGVCDCDDDDGTYLRIYVPLITSDVHSIRRVGNVHILDENQDRRVVVASYSYVLDYPSCSPLLLDRMRLMGRHGV